MSRSGPPKPPDPRQTPVLQGNPVDSTRVHVSAEISALDESTPIPDSLVNSLEGPPSQSRNEPILEEGMEPQPSSMRIPHSGELPGGAFRARALRQSRENEAEEDLELVRRVQQGDNKAFRSLVERHQRRAFAIALSLVRHEQDARDIVQDAFLRVHRSLSSFQGSSSFFTWLYRIVTNLAIDLVRRPGRNTDELEEDRQRISSTPGSTDQPDPMWVSKIDGADPLDVLRRKELAVRMQEAIDSLPPYHKAVIVMREVDGLSYEEMADLMQVSKGTIMSRLFHARQKLQKALADCYEEENGK